MSILERIGGVADTVNLSAIHPHPVSANSGMDRTDSSHKLGFVIATILLVGGHLHRLVTLWEIHNQHGIHDRNVHLGKSGFWNLLRGVFIWSFS